MSRTTLRSLAAAALAVVLALAAVPAATAGPSAELLGPAPAEVSWSWLNAWIHRLFGASEGGPDMDPDGVEAAPETGPDGAEAGPDMDPNGAHGEAGPDMDPNG
jgi:hypothetical protein